MLALKHPREAERLLALHRLEILDTPREDRFDNIVELAAELCETPIAVINLIDENRQWFKAETGLGVRETPLETSICSHIILQPGLTIINDTLADARMCDNPLCLAEPGLRFYAGATLVIEDGLPIGTLCVLDFKPRDLTERQKKNLAVLADQVVTHINLRQQLRQSKQLAQEIDHRVRNSLGLVQSLLSLQARHTNEDHTRKALEIARDRVAAVAHVHDLLHRSSSVDQVDLRSFVRQLTTALQGQTGERIALTTDLPSCNIHASDAANIGVMINELVTNALRHAFPNDVSGAIRVSGEVEDGTLSITITDNGIGLPEGFRPQASNGLGMRLATALAKQFGNDLAWKSGAKGTQFTFRISCLGPRADGDQDCDA